MKSPSYYTFAFSYFLFFQAHLLFSSVLPVLVLNKISLENKALLELTSLPSNFSFLFIPLLYTFYSRSLGPHKTWVSLCFITTISIHIYFFFSSSFLASSNIIVIFVIQLIFKISFAFAMTALRGIGLKCCGNVTN